MVLRYLLKYTHQLVRKKWVNEILIVFFNPKKNCSSMNTKFKKHISHTSLHRKEKSENIYDLFMHKHTFS